MNARIQILLGVSIVAIAVVTDMILPFDGTIWPIPTALFALVLAIAGLRLPLIVRTVATGFIFIFAFQMFLIGRTSEPFLSANTIRMALIPFGGIAMIPGLALLRGWQGRTRVWVCSLILPASLVFACLVAAYEESRFIAQHSSGAGPTNRWTVPMHWLSYDPATRKLEGSD